MSNNQEGKSLKKLRSRIDELDSELLKLLNERAKCVIKIGKIKQKEKKDVLVPLREKELLDRLRTVNEGPMTDAMVIYLFQQIIDTLKDLQK
ncbi:MAG: chorismate mutase [SAR324 cluster bacterium]|nr:chorismate mutase [SAR324 cluster bacterium]